MFHAKRRRSLPHFSEYSLLIAAVILWISTTANCQSTATCDKRKCRMRLDRGEIEDVRFPDSFQSVIGYLDDVRWTFTASDDESRILLTVVDINWPNTELGFEELNPRRIEIRNKDEVFPNFPEYNDHVITSGLFLTSTHVLRMEMDIPVEGELPTAPSFSMQFTALSVTDVYWCRLNSMRCDVVSSIHWQRTSNGYEYDISGLQANIDLAYEGTMTVSLPATALPLKGRGFLSFGYLFKYSGTTGGNGARDETGRVTVECPGKRNFRISPAGDAKLAVDCDLEKSSITFTAEGSLHLTITDVSIQDAYNKTLTRVESGTDTSHPSSSSASPVVVGLAVFAGSLTVIVFAFLVTRKIRMMREYRRKYKARQTNGVTNPCFSPEHGREEEDNTYHYPSFAPTPPPRKNESIYQEIEKKESAATAANTPRGQGLDDNDDNGKYAYDLLQLPGSKPSAVPEARHLASSTLPAKGMSQSGTSSDSNRYDMPRPQTCHFSRAVTLNALDPSKANESVRNIPKPAPVKHEYLEIIGTLEMSDVEGSIDSQPALAHQDLYQRLQRPDNPYNTLPQAVATQSQDDTSSTTTTNTDTADQSYGQLDLTLKTDVTEATDNEGDYSVLEPDL